MYQLAMQNSMTILSNLMNQTWVTYLWFLGYGVYRQFDVWGKRCHRFFPIVRKHNPMTIATIRKQLLVKINRNRDRNYRNSLLRRVCTPPPSSHADPFDQKPPVVDDMAELFTLGRTPQAMNGDSGDELARASAALAGAPNSHHAENDNDNSGDPSSSQRRAPHVDAASAALAFPRHLAPARPEFHPELDVSEPGGSVEGGGDTVER